MATSPRASPSPPGGPVEDRLPEGHCRYLLPQQELRGQRCGCVHFTLNRGIPSATCLCGHQSCFHTTEPYVPELEHLKTKVKSLEAEVVGKFKALEMQAERALEEKLQLMARVGELEEMIEKSREETSQEIKATYHNIDRAWHQVDELVRQAKEAQLRLRHHGEQIQALQDETRRLEDRQLELSDADLSLEERLEILEEEFEGSTLSPGASRSRPRRPSQSDGDATPPASHQPSFEPGRATRTPGPALTALTIPPTLRPPIPAAPPLSASESSKVWTVHVSLLPSASLPFPFEKNTNAYNRCLSRGLHQMVVMQGWDAESIKTCVSDAFRDLLKGRPWMPLQARLCNAESLQGLPMLRRLDDSLVHGRYDAEFLRRHCAVCDSNGKMDSFYIAMCFDTLSWHSLRHSPVYMAGLESCWNYDRYLDPGNPFDDDDAIDDGDRPSAGDLIPSTFSSLKRAASEISRSSSFGAASAQPTSASAAAVSATSAANDGEGSRPKVQRVLPNIVEGRRRIETV